MIPTLQGRLETRVFLTVVVGGIWTILVTPFVYLSAEGDAMGDGFGQTYKVTFPVLAIVLVLGLLWELVYHGLMQFRWEKDWPTLFGWLTGINEGLLAFAVARTIGTTDFDTPEWRLLLDHLPVTPFLVHFVSTWIVVQLFANNLMQVLFIRWRFRGGRLLGDWSP